MPMKNQTRDGAVPSTQTYMILHFVISFSRLKMKENNTNESCP